MRLLFLSNMYPPYELGGYEQWCQEVATGLQERGNTVWILTSRHGFRGVGRTELGIFRALYLQADVHHYKPLDFFVKRVHQDALNRRELRRVINLTGPDLIIVWGMWNLSHSLPFWAEQWLPGRVAYYVSSYWPNDLDIHREYWQLPARRSLTELVKKPFRRIVFSQLRREGYPPRLQFEHAVCCSQYVRTTLVTAGKLPASSGILLGGIDPAPFSENQVVANEPSNGCLRLLFAGSLFQHKGIHTALEALGLLKLRGAHERVSLTILGGGHPDYEEQLHKMVEQLGISSQVHFVGRVPRSEIPQWMSRFNVFLFTSIWAEPMARTVMEAMAAGLTVIGTEVGGQTEMLRNGQNALTFPAGNAAVLAEHIETLIYNPQLRSELAAAGQTMILEKFHLTRMVDDLETWFTGIVANNPAPQTSLCLSGKTLTT